MIEAKIDDKGVIRVIRSFMFGYSFFRLYNWDYFKAIVKALRFMSHQRVFLHK